MQYDGEQLDGIPLIFVHGIGSLIALAEARAGAVGEACRLHPHCPDFVEQFNASTKAVGHEFFESREVLLATCDTIEDLEDPCAISRWVTEELQGRSSIAAAILDRQDAFNHSIRLRQLIFDNLQSARLRGTNVLTCQVTSDHLVLAVDAHAEICFHFHPSALHPFFNKQHYTQMWATDLSQAHHKGILEDRVAGMCYSDALLY
jgi:hypothetical protein